MRTRARARAKTSIGRKRSISGWWVVLYSNTLDMYKQENAIDFGRRYEVEDTSRQKYNVYYDYMQHRSPNKYGETVYERVYNTRKLHRMVQDKDIQDLFPEHFI